MVLQINGALWYAENHAESTHRFPTDVHFGPGRLDRFFLHQDFDLAGTVRKCVYAYVVANTDEQAAAAIQAYDWRMTPGLIEKKTGGHWPGIG